MPDSTNNITHTADRFRTGHITAIQPSMGTANLNEGVMETVDPKAITFTTNLLRLWSFDRNDLPHDFVDEVTVTQLVRQPLTIVDVQLEVTHRATEKIDEPYPGGEIDGDPWPTDDLFKLVPLTVGQFPTESKVVSQRVPSGEEIAACSECDSAGETACGSCEGGRVTCTDCSGTRRVSCPRCLGVGSHFGSRNLLVNCQLCRGRGTRRCVRCDRGLIDCSRCSGTGSLTCLPCGGHGNIHSHFRLSTRTETKQYFESSCSEPWPFKGESLAKDSIVLHSEKSDWPLISWPEQPISEWAPPHLHTLIQDHVDECMVNCVSQLDLNEQITSAKVRLRGIYSYAVSYQYHDDTTQVFVSGLSNQIFSELGQAQRRSSLVRGFKKLGYHVSNTVGNYTSPVDRSYLKAVRNSQIHIGDTRQLFPQVAEALLVNFEMSITEAGYKFQARDDHQVSIEVSFDFNRAGQPLICLSRDLAQAERQRFQQALELNNELSFGRVCTRNMGGGFEAFVIADRRLYQWSRPSQIARIIKVIFNESQQILDKGMLF